MNKYITIKFRKIIESDKYLIVYSEIDGNRVFPMLIPQSAYYYLEKIDSDKLFQENFMVDLIHELEEPKEIFLEKINGSYSSYYISNSNKRRVLNLIDIFTLSIRYDMPINLSKVFLKTEIRSDNFISNIPYKLDMYRLNKKDFETFKH